MAERAKWVEHTQFVLSEAETIVGSAVDMETGLRGYLLAGQEQFLEPYNGGEASAYAALGSLQQTVSDNPPQVERLQQAEGILREWQGNVAETAITLRRDIGDARTMNDMADLVGEARGKAFFDKFRNQIATFISREQVLLEERQAAFEAARAQVAANRETVTEANRWVEHTHKVLAQASRIIAHGVDMETGYRGYMLTGEKAFLEPYNNGKAAFREAIAELQKTVSDNPPQVGRLKEADTLISSWIKNVIEPGMKLRRQVNVGVVTLDEIDRFVSEQKGKQYFDAFRSLMADFSAIEAKLIVERQATAKAAEEAIAGALATMNDTQNWTIHTYKVIATANDIIAAAVDMETGMRGYLLAGQEAFLEPYNAGGARFGELVAGLSDTVSDNPTQVELLSEVQATIDGWRENVTEPMIALRREIGDAATMDDMADLVGEGRGKTYFDAFRQVMADFQTEEEALMVTRREANEAISTQTRTMLPVAIGMAVLIGSVLALVIGNSMAKAVQGITRAMQGLAEGDNAVKITGQERGDEIGDMARSLEVFRDELAKMQEAELKKAEGKDAELKKVVQELSARLSRLSGGDLTIQIQEVFPEEYEQLRADFNASIDTLHSTVLQVVESTSSIHNGAAEISQASDDLSQRTESQAATLEQTAASIDELTASVKASAEGARNVESTVQEARQEAENSGEVVQNAVTAMAGIAESSNKISQIIGVIDDIAFQTNLLALNAGVEAARAGEAGRGFAVVASEVRTLAQRSSEAAMDIKALIGDSTSQVEQGVDLVGRAGEALQYIVGRVSDISRLISEIAEGAAEQSTGLAEVNSGMMQLDQVTQQNAAMVEQATAAGHTLNSDAGTLSELVARFQVRHQKLDAPAAENVENTHSSTRDREDWKTQSASVQTSQLHSDGNAAREMWQDL
ncbi:CHASE3 domain-containing protein [Phaeobacter sp. 11ANDIMAR09]|uniref:CHASE3 domain-containing protein n=1 Tax=Phaeobacter sp. 11ANDIMAR09 TaxID=1225647 RepID=UPI0020A0A020|nr:CHASE3 domain-containing protein [Phaeobacter sp. 11ANDIMAR09]